MRTRFQETTDTIYALKLLSDICCGAKVVYNDNGIATTVTTQKGVALQSNEQIRPIITLKPYRTFQVVFWMCSMNSFNIVESPPYANLMIFRTGGASWTFPSIPVCPGICGTISALLI